MNTRAIAGHRCAAARAAAGGRPGHRRANVGQPDGALGGFARDVHGRRCRAVRASMCCRRISPRTSCPSTAFRWWAIPSIDVWQTTGASSTSCVTRLATFEPGAEPVGVRDWVVRYASSAQSAGQSAPARELAIPGAPLAWRSALPGAIAALDLRAARRDAGRHQRGGSSPGRASLALIALSAALFAAAIVRRVSAGGRLRVKRRMKRTSARDVQSAFSAIRDGDVNDAASTACGVRRSRRHGPAHGRGHDGGTRPRR